MRAVQKSIAGLSLLLISLSLNANTFSKNGKDPIRPVSSAGEGNPYAAIGRIVTQVPVPADAKNPSIVGYSEGTGFLISPCLVMTNYHVVFGKSKIPSKPTLVSFTAGRKVIGSVVSWGPKNTTNRIEDDWAVIELNPGECLGLEHGWFEPSYDPDLATKTPMTIAGFPAKRFDPANSGQVWAHNDCWIKDTFSRQFPGSYFNDCATSPGQSGSPLFYQAEDGSYKVVAMQTVQLDETKRILKKYDANRANVAIPFVSVMVDGPVELLRADLELQNKSCKLQNKLAKNRPPACY